MCGQLATEHPAVITIDSRFERGLAVMFEENDITPGLLDILDQVASRPAFYSMPVYTRYAQLGFMAEQGYPEVNRQLIRASVAFLEQELARRLAVGDARVRDYLLCMVSITGWDLDPDDERGFNGCNDGSLGYITPYIFVGDLRSKLLADFDVRETGTAPAFQPPSAGCTDFTAAALSHCSDYIISQNPAPDGWPADRYQWWPDRVYVRIGGYPATQTRR